MLKTAVIGVGYLGKFHAQKYAGLFESQLIGVVDIDRKKGEKVAAELEVDYFDKIAGSDLRVKGEKFKAIREQDVVVTMKDVNSVI